jgi:hypothetical protein
LGIDSEESLSDDLGSIAIDLLVDLFHVTSPARWPMFTVGLAAFKQFLDQYPPCIAPEPFLGIPYD